MNRRSTEHAEEAYSAYLVAHDVYAALYSGWRGLLRTPRFRRAERKQHDAWERYSRLVAKTTQRARLAPGAVAKFYEGEEPRPAHGQKEREGGQE